MNSEELRQSYGYGYGVVADQRKSRKTPFEMVHEFHRTYGQPVGESPQMLSEARANLRWELIHEEYLEVAEALDNNDLINLVKELADLIYVVNGFAVELGVNLDDVVEEVHRSNMSKLGADGKPIYREDGKVLKGPDYFEADIETVIGTVSE